MTEEELLQAIKQYQLELQHYLIGEFYWEILDNIWHTQQALHELRRKAEKNFKYYD